MDAAPPHAPRRRLRLRFSLLTLLCFVMLAGCGMALWKTWAPWELEREFKGHNEAIWHVTFSHDGKRVASSASEGTVRIWDVESGATVANLVVNATGRAIYRCEFSHDDQKILTVCWHDSAITLWDIETKRPLFSLAGTTSVYSAAFSPDGTRIVGGSQKIQLWDTRDGHSILEGDSLSVHYFLWHDFSPDGTRILTLTGTGPVHVFDARTGKRLMELASGDTMRASFSHDGKRIITSDYYLDPNPRDSCANRTRVQIRDAQNGTLLRQLPEFRHITLALFSRDGTHVLTYNEKGTLQVCNTETGTAIYAWKGSSVKINSAAYSPDGSRLLIGDANGLVRIFRRNRPEEWWGLAHLPAFWAMVLFAGLFGWSFFRDRRHI